MESNVARRLAAETFVSTLESCRDRIGVTEREFSEMWLARMRETGQLTDGWYDPPPRGVAVLSGLSRISFDSLRPDVNWPGQATIDWDNGCLYAYCSPVSKETFALGDFAITLYFGSDERMRAHFSRTYQAVRDVLNAALSERSSRALFQQSIAIFARYNLRNCAAGVIASTPPNLGHTLPSAGGIRAGASQLLPPQTMSEVRRARRFVSSEDDWDCSNFGQYTVEPQLVNISDETLPQVSYHYIIDPSRRIILNEPDAIIRSLEHSWLKS